MRPRALQLALDAAVTIAALVVVWAFAWLLYGAVWAAAVWL